MFEGGFEQSPVCLGFVHTVSGRFGLSNHTCLRWSKAFKVQAFEGPQRADKRTGYLAFARVPIRHFRAASRCFLPMDNSMELTTLEAASCLACCRSSRLVQTSGAEENSLSIPSMQAFSAVLHVSAVRPILSRSATSSMIPKADAAMVPTEGKRCRTLQNGRF